MLLKNLVAAVRHSRSLSSIAESHLLVKAKPPLPPFTKDSATLKVRMAEDAWNSRDPERVSLVYTEDTTWRNRTEFFSGRSEVKKFLERK